jgi:hypothetical protein
MAEFQIDRGVPLPEKTRFMDRCPFKEMSVGDSFPASLEEGPNVRTAVFYWKLIHPKQNFTVRKVSGSYRCWRTK